MEWEVFMIINIKVMTDSAYESFRKNNEKIYEFIKKYPTNNDWIYEVFGDHIFETKKYIIEDFNLEYSKNYSDVEYQNAIILYESLKYLPRHILCDNKFWAWIILEKAYIQSQQAMELSPSVIKNFWFEKNARRSVMLNVMGRQYFKVELSIDEELVNNKYMLTKFLFTNHNIYKNFSYRNNFILKNVSLAVLRSEYYFTNTFNIKISDELASEFGKKISRLGSIKLLDIMTIDEIYNYICVKMLPIIKNYSEGKTVSK